MGNAEREDRLAAETRGQQFDAEGQLWVLTWHAAGSPPGGEPMGSVGICFTPEGGIVIISGDDIHWDLPGGHPEDGLTCH